MVRGPGGFLGPRRTDRATEGVGDVEGNEDIGRSSSTVNYQPALNSYRDVNHWAKLLELRGVSPYDLII